MQACLRVTAGPDAGRTFDLVEGTPMVIGRGEKSDTRLTDGMVFRLHCEIKWEGHGFNLNDREEVATRADINGVGARLYARLTGKPPFKGKTFVETITQIRQSDPTPPRTFQLSIPDQLQDAVLVMLARRPEMRHQNPSEVVRARAGGKVPGDDGRIPVPATPEATSLPARTP